MEFRVSKDLFKMCVRKKERTEERKKEGWAKKKMKAMLCLLWHRNEGGRLGRSRGMASKITYSLINKP